MPYLPCHLVNVTINLVDESVSSRHIIICPFCKEIQGPIGRATDGANKCRMPHCGKVYYVKRKGVATWTAKKQR